MPSRTNVLLLSAQPSKVLVGVLQKIVLQIFCCCDVMCSDVVDVMVPDCCELL